MAFDIVGDYLNDVRTLLQDRVLPYRYSTVSLVGALNLTLFEVRRIRPDLFFDYLDNVPQYQWVDASSVLVPGMDANFDDDDNPTWSEWVPLEQQFRQAVVFGIAAHAMRRDQEDIQDERATGYMLSFSNMMLDVSPTKGTQPPKG